jgi:hypothetical protein
MSSNLLIGVLAAAVAKRRMTDKDRAALLATYATSSAAEQHQVATTLARSLGIPLEKQKTAPASGGERTRAALVAREGELDSEDRRVMARAFGTADPDDGRGEWSPNGTRVRADGRMQLSVLRGARGSAKLEEDDS